MTTEQLRRQALLSAMKNNIPTGDLSRLYLDVWDASYIARLDAIIAEDLRVDDKNKKVKNLIVEENGARMQQVGVYAPEPE